MTLEDRFIGSLMGVRIGDGLGIPWESMEPEEILAITGPEGVNEYWDPQQRDDAPEWARALRVLTAGAYSDDWQKTRAGARSLIHRGGFDVIDVARETVAEMRACDLGWGGTTKWGLRQVAMWLDTFRARDGARHPEDFPIMPEDKVGRFGTGNGVAMSVAPFGLWGARFFNKYGEYIQSSGEMEFMLMVWRVGGLTHPDPRATVGAYVIAATIARICAMDKRRTDSLRMLEEMIGDARAMETSFSMYFTPEMHEDMISDRLGQVRRLLEAGASAQHVREQIGTSSYTPESVPFSIATFLRQPDCPREALKEAVEAGGDTDTNAAIVGSLIGANAGAQMSNMDLRARGGDYLDFQEPAHLGRALYQAYEASLFR